MRAIATGAVVASKRLRTLVCTCTCVPAFSVSFVAVSEQAMHTTRLIDCETVLTFKPLDDGVFITCVGDAQGAGEVQ